MNAVFKPAYGRISESQFNAPRWARNAHVQTIYPKFFMRKEAIHRELLIDGEIPFKRVRLDTPDNDFLDLALLFPPKERQVKAIAVLFHGLEGSQNSHYIRHLAGTLLKQDIATVLMHFRGCSGEINRTARAYHSGETSDAKYCIDWIKREYLSGDTPPPFFAVGFSLGGNMLLKLLGEETHSGITAAVSVSAPIDLSASSQAINIGFAKRYQSHLLATMQNNLIQKMAKMDLRPYIQLSANDVRQLNSFRLFDEYVTSRLHGFKDANDYYAKSSAMQFLPSINTPTLILHAADDPFMDERVIPKQKQLSKHIAYELSTHGGHVGFMAGSPLQPTLWLPQRISAFFQEFL
jgi:predicted alpha/beta-fold hydrolase